MSDYRKVGYLLIRPQRRHILPAVLGAAALACVIGAFILNGQSAEVASPQRVASDTSSSATPAPATPSVPPATATPTPIPTPTELPLPPVGASDIVNVSIASIGLDVAVSGETFPRKTQNCKGDEYCIDPPVADQAAWYGDPPSWPSVNPVLLFGHTSWNDPAYATFNNLPAVVQYDEVRVTTRTGVFVYEAQAPVLVPYNEAPQSETIFGWETEKLVLVTCNNAESAATVVVAHLVEVIPLP